MAQVVIPEAKMARYIRYCLNKPDETCQCPYCNKIVSGLRSFPYFYDDENNDVYFATRCPDCGELMIDKE